MKSVLRIGVFGLSISVLAAMAGGCRDVVVSDPNVSGWFDQSNNGLTDDTTDGGDDVDGNSDVNDSSNDAAFGSISFLTPMENEVISADAKGYEVNWLAEGLSDPKFEVTMQNADGTPFRNFGFRGRDQGNGNYNFRWTPGSRGEVSPGIYQLTIRDVNSGVAESLFVELL